MDLVGRIKDIDLFQGLSHEQMKKLAAQSRYRIYAPGELIVGEEDLVRTFYVVVSGKVKLYKSSAEGKEQTLYLLGPGEPFGLCTAFANDAFPASAMTLDESAILIIPGPAMENIARSEPLLLLNILHVLSRRLKASMSLVESLALKEIPGRLASFILHSLSQERGASEGRLTLSITQRELAKILGATPEALSRALKKMSSDGLINVEGRIIQVLDRKALEELAEGE
ncbi:MAG: Crp/Fnr family transcriptional regulator [Smithellaceae bacterium]|nr:Crp/Fnr family transcriptional regulator [Smithellaceae bacterium]